MSRRFFLIRSVARPGTGRRGSAAFTLVEMLAVMAIMVTLLGLIVPVVTSLTSAGDITREAYDMADTLEKARAYAMSHNTYVYVGIEEVDAGQPDSGSQDGTGKGRIGMAVMGTKDGTRGYDLNHPETWLSNYSSNVQGFFPLGPLQHFENLHLVDLGASPVAGGMVRPPASPDQIAPLYDLARAECLSVTPFSYPLGSGLATGHYVFYKVIQFDPQGVPRIQTSGNTDAVANYLEIGLQQTHGASVPSLPSPPTSGPIAAIQIDGLSGSVRVYRP